MRRLMAVTVVVLALLASSSLASAATNPTSAGYGGKAGEVAAKVTPKNRVPAQRTPGTSPGTDRRGGPALPFTGLDLGLLLGGGAVLLVVGGSLWRLTREKA